MKAPLEFINGENGEEHFRVRTKVPGGWLIETVVQLNGTAAVAGYFYPDPMHQWQEGWEELSKKMHDFHDADIKAQTGRLGTLLDEQYAAMKQTKED